MQLAPRLVHDEVARIHDETNNKINQLQQLATGLSELGIKSGEPEEGEAELGMFVPRTGADLSLNTLIEEATDLDRLVSSAYHIVERQSHSPAVSYLVSCDYGFLVNVGPQVLKFLMDLIEQALTIAHKFASAKEAFDKLRDHGTSDETIERLVAERKAHHDEALDRLVSDAIHLVRGDPAAEPEQATLLTIQVKKFVQKRIERGNYIDIRVGIESVPETAEGQAQSEELRQLRERVAEQRTLQNLAQRIHALEQQATPEIAALAPPRGTA